MRVLVLFVWLCSGCDGLAYVGELDQPVDALVATNVFFAPTLVDERPVYLGIDTGAPINIIATRHLASGTFGPANATLRIGELEFPGVRVMGDNFLDGGGEPPIAGLIGCTILCPLGVTLDYRASQLAIGHAAPPADAAAPIEIPFTLAGGGNARYGTSGGTVHTVALPRSRILVDAEIEGRPLRLMVDTGASANVLRSSIADSLLADGRGSAVLPVGGMFGTVPGTQFRLRDLTLDGVRLDGAVALAGSAFDRLFDTIGSEVRERLDGVVGGTFLRAFHVDVDYARRVLVLSPYRDLAHVHDEGHQTGLVVDIPAVAAITGGLTVREVVPGTDAAAQGVLAGDVVLAVEGVALDGRPPYEAQYLLTGQVGQTRQVQLRDAGTLTLAIDRDALALP
ncbi:MAG: aspartyl protease family protein [Sandaracinaceae bacterium]|nr:aspartyl protease family protein [Sandaracinaceae bacterium]